MVQDKIIEKWAEQFRSLCAGIAGVKLFDNMWVEKTKPIGTEELPWNAISIERPFPEDWPEDEDWTLAIRAFSFKNRDEIETILKNQLQTCMTKAAHKNEMYVAPIMIDEESFKKACEKGLAALKEFKLVYQSPFYVQLMLDEGGVDYLIKINL